MPSAPRSNEKAADIAYAIIGKPVTMEQKETSKSKGNSKKIEMNSPLNGYSRY